MAWQFAAGRRWAEQFHTQPWVAYPICTGPAGWPAAVLADGVGLLLERCEAGSTKAEVLVRYGVAVMHVHGISPQAFRLSMSMTVAADACAPWEHVREADRAYSSRGGVGLSM